MALYHTAQGSVNYAVEGSPTIVDGIASGFTSSSYIRSAVQLPITDKNYEFVIKCTPHTDARNGAVLGVNNQFRIYFMLNKIEFEFFQTSGVSNYLTISTNFTSGTYYYIKVKRQNDIASVSYSTDGITYVSEHTITNEFKNTSGYVQYGYWGGDGWDPYNGSIDLNETYITVNGQPWFGDCPIEVKKHQIMGPVGYEVVGSPTINNGVASGFSVDDYLSLSQSFSNASSFEMVFKVKFDSTLQGGIFHSNCISLQKYADSNLELLYRNTSDSWQAIRGGSSLPQADTWCWIKVGYQSGSISLDFSSDGSSYTNVGTASYTLNNYNINSAEIGMHGSDNYFRGSVDLNETYIKVSNEMWFFQPAPTKYIIREDKNTHEQKLVFADQSMYLTGPVNYTVVGNPTIVDNVASNFSDNNYLQAGSHITFNNNSNVEFNVRFKTPSDLSNTTAQYLVCFSNSNGHYGVTYGNDGIFEIRLPQRSGGAYGYGISYQTNTWYYIKSVIQNNGCETFLYDNTGTQIWHVAFSQFLGSFSLDSVLTIGLDTLLDFSQSGVQGSIDLNKTYIKVNGDLWFYGKNYASSNMAPVPSRFTYGSTTAPQIGYVDMRTQAYHKAPAGTALVSGSGSVIYDDYIIEDNRLVYADPRIYLEATGTQYIDTGVNINSQYTFKMKLQTRADTMEGNNFYLCGGAFADNDLFGFTSLTYNTGKQQFYLGLGSVLDATENVQFDPGYKGVVSSQISNGKYQLLKDGVLVSELTEVSFSSQRDIMLYKYGINYNFAVGKIYRCKLFDENNALLRDFVPVPAGLVIGNFTVPSNGMFDIVNQQFYPNLGTGEFVIGRDE